MFDNLKILFHQGRQYIPDVTKAKVPGIFRGRPIITTEKINEQELAGQCPVNAISTNPLSIDLGKCTFCGECAFAFPNKIKFTTDYKIATNRRERLIIKEGDDKSVELNADLIRKEIYEYFSSSLKLRQVSAGGDNSCELELNACGNVNFDMGRFGIEFVASPRHADGIVISGTTTRAMEHALEATYEAVPKPKLIILFGACAISGGIFQDSGQLAREFIEKHKV